MVEWHITPDYIVNNWTDELLDLMIEKMVERANRVASSSGSEGNSPARARTLSPNAAVKRFHELGTMGSKVKVIDNSGN